MRRTAYLFIILAAVLPVTAFADTADHINAGNRQYKKGEYRSALDRYRDARISAPDSPVASFNSGDALYRMSDYGGATEEFSRAAAAGTAKQRSRAWYNLGNTAYKAGKTDEALRCYRNALRLDPADRDAKYNLEYLLREKAGGKNGRDEKKKDKGGAGKDQQQQQQKNTEQQGQKNSNGGTGNEQQQQTGDGSGRNDGKMTKDEARRLLEMFNEQDTNSAQNRRLAVPRLPQVEEDW